MKEQAISEQDLQQINRFTLREMTTDDVAVYSMLIITDEPTSNGRVWSREWMAEAVNRNLFDGIPFLTNHENDQTLKIGTIFSAELTESGVVGKVFIPRDNRGKECKRPVNRIFNRPVF